MGGREPSEQKRSTGGKGKHCQNLLSHLKVISQVVVSSRLVCFGAHTSKEHRLSSGKLATTGRRLCSSVNPTCHPALPKHQSKAHWITENRAAEWGCPHARWRAFPMAMVPAPPPQKTNWSMSGFLLHKSQSLRRVWRREDMILAQAV